MDRFQRWLEGKAEDVVDAVVPAASMAVAPIVAGPVRLAQGIADNTNWDLILNQATITPGVGGAGLTPREVTQPVPQQPSTTVRPGPVNALLPGATQAAGGMLGASSYLPSSWGEFSGDVNEYWQAVKRSGESDWNAGLDLISVGWDQMWGGDGFNPELSAQGFNRQNIMLIGGGLINTIQAAGGAARNGFAEIMAMSALERALGVQQTNSIGANAPFNFVDQYLREHPEEAQAALNAYQNGYNGYTGARAVHEYIIGKQPWAARLAGDVLNDPITWISIGFGTGASLMRAAGEAPSAGGKILQIAGKTYNITDAATGALRPMTHGDVYLIAGRTLEQAGRVFDIATDPLFSGGARLLNNAPRVRFDGFRPNLSGETTVGGYIGRGVGAGLDSAARGIVARDTTGQAWWSEPAARRLEATNFNTRAADTADAGMLATTTSSDFTVAPTALLPWEKPVAPSGMWQVITPKKNGDSYIVDMFGRPIGVRETGKDAAGRLAPEARRLNERAATSKGLTYETWLTQAPTRIRDGRALATRLLFGDTFQYTANAQTTPDKFTQQIEELWQTAPLMRRPNDAGMRDRINAWYDYIGAVVQRDANGRVVDIQAKPGSMLDSFLNEWVELDFRWFDTDLDGGMVAKVMQQQALLNSMLGQMMAADRRLVGSGVGYQFNQTAQHYKDTYGVDIPLDANGLPQVEGVIGLWMRASTPLPNEERILVPNPNGSGEITLRKKRELDLFALTEDLSNRISWGSKEDAAKAIRALAGRFRNGRAVDRYGNEWFRQTIDQLTAAARIARNANAPLPNVPTPPNAAARQVDLDRNGNPLPNTPDPAQSLRDETNAIGFWQDINREPPVPAGKYRVYHSGNPPGVTGQTKRWVATDREYASNYRPDLDLWYIDLDINDPRLYAPGALDQYAQDVAAGDTGARKRIGNTFELTAEESAALQPTRRSSLPPGPIAASGDISVPRGIAEPSGGWVPEEDGFDQGRRRRWVELGGSPAVNNFEPVLTPQSLVNGDVEHGTIDGMQLWQNPQTQEWVVWDVVRDQPASSPMTFQQAERTRLNMSSQPLPSAQTTTANPSPVAANPAARPAAQGAPDVQFVSFNGAEYIKSQTSASARGSLALFKRRGAAEFVIVNIDTGEIVRGPIAGLKNANEALRLVENSNAMASRQSALGVLGARSQQRAGMAMRADELGGVDPAGNMVLRPGDLSGRRTVTPQTMRAGTSLPVTDPNVSSFFGDQLQSVNVMRPNQNGDDDFWQNVFFQDDGFDAAPKSKAKPVTSVGQTPVKPSQPPTSEPVVESTVAQQTPLVQEPVTTPTVATTPNPILAQPVGSAGSAQYPLMRVSDLSTDEVRFQPREGLDQQKVKSIAENWSFSSLDPLHVWVDPQDGKTYVLAGHHRLQAARQAGIESVPVLYFTGTEKKAIVHAQTSNSRTAPQSEVENARMVRRLRDAGLSHKEISAEANLTEVRVKQLENISYAPQQVQDLLTMKEATPGEVASVGWAIRSGLVESGEASVIYFKMRDQLGRKPTSVEIEGFFIGKKEVENAGRQVDLFSAAGMDAPGTKQGSGLIDQLTRIANKRRELENAKAAVRRAENVNQRMGLGITGADKALARLEQELQALVNELTSTPTQQASLGGMPDLPAAIEPTTQSPAAPSLPLFDEEPNTMSAPTLPTTPVAEAPASGNAGLATTQPATGLKPGQSWRDSSPVIVTFPGERGYSYGPSGRRYDTGSVRTESAVLREVVNENGVVVERWYKSDPSKPGVWQRVDDKNRVVDNTRSWMAIDEGGNVVAKNVSRDRATQSLRKEFEPDSFRQGSATYNSLNYLPGGMAPGSNRYVLIETSSGVWAVVEQSVWGARGIVTYKPRAVGMSKDEAMAYVRTLKNTQMGAGASPRIADRLAKTPSGYSGYKWDADDGSLLNDRFIYEIPGYSKDGVQLEIGRAGRENEIVVSGGYDLQNGEAMPDASFKTVEEALIDVDRRVYLTSENFKLLMNGETNFYSGIPVDPLIRSAKAGAGKVATRAGESLRPVLSQAAGVAPSVVPPGRTPGMSGFPGALEKMRANGELSREQVELLTMAMPGDPNGKTVIETWADLVADGKSNEAAWATISGQIRDWGRMNRADRAAMLANGGVPVQRQLNRLQRLDQWVNRYLIEMPRQQMMYNPVTGYKGALQDLLGNTTHNLINGQYQAAVDMFTGAGPERLWWMIKNPGAVQEVFTQQTDSVLRAAGVSLPSEVMNPRLQARIDVEEDELILHQLLSKRRIGKTVGNVLQSKRALELRNATDTLSRGTTMIATYMNGHPAAVQRFRALLRKNGIDDDAFMREVMQTAQVRTGDPGVVTFAVRDIHAVTKGMKMKPELKQGLARAWREEQQGLIDAGRKAVGDAFFVGKRSGNVSAMSRAFYFHFWLTQSTAMHVRKMIESPRLFRAYVNLWNGVEEEAEKNGYPPTLTGMVQWFKGESGMAALWNPMLLVVPSFIFDSAIIGNEDTGFIEAVSSMMPFTPILGGALAAIGKSDKVPDFLGTRGNWEKIGQTVLTWAASKGLDLTGGGAKPEPQIIEEATAKGIEALNSVAQWFGADDVNLYLTSEGRSDNYTAILNEEAIRQWGPMDTWTPEEWDEYSQAYQSIKTGSRATPLAERVQDIYANWQFGVTAANLVVPGGVMMRYGPRDEARRLDNLGVRSAGTQRDLQRATGEAGALIIGRETARAGARETIGDADMRWVNGYNDIREGFPDTTQFRPDDWVLIGGQKVTISAIRAMPESQRQVLADQFLNERGARAIYQDYETLRKTAEKALPGGEVTDWRSFQQMVYDYNGGPRGFRAAARTSSPNWARAEADKRRYLEGQGKSGALLEEELDGWAVSTESYLAFTGQRESVYDADPLSVGTGNSTLMQWNLGRDQGSPRSTADVVRNELRDDRIRNELSQWGIFGSLAGINVSPGPMGSTAQLYTNWAASRPGMDNSPEMFGMWLAQNGGGQPLDRLPSYFRDYAPR